MNDTSHDSQVEKMTLIPRWFRLLAPVVSLACHFFPILIVTMILQLGKAVIGNLLAIFMAGGLTILAWHLFLIPIAPERKKRASFLLFVALGVIGLSGLAMTTTGLLADRFLQLAFYLQLIPSLAGWGVATFTFLKHWMEWDPVNRQLALVTDAFITTRRKEAFLDSETILTFSLVNFGIKLDFFSRTTPLDEDRGKKAMKSSTWTVLYLTNVVEIFYTLVRWCHDAEAIMTLNGKLLQGKLRETFHELSSAEAGHVDTIDFSLTSPHVDGPTIKIKGLDELTPLQQVSRDARPLKSREGTSAVISATNDAILEVISKSFHPHHEVTVTSGGSLQLRARYRGSPRNRIKKIITLVFTSLITLLGLSFLVIGLALLKLVLERDVNDFPWDQIPLIGLSSLLALGVMKMMWKHFLLTFFSTTELAFTATCMEVKKKLRQWTLESWIFPKQALVNVIIDRGHVKFVFFGGKCVSIRIGKDWRNLETVREIISVLFSSSAFLSFSGSGIGEDQKQRMDDEKRHSHNKKSGDQARFDF